MLNLSPLQIRLRKGKEKPHRGHTKLRPEVIAMTCLSDMPRAVTPAYGPRSAKGNEMDTMRSHHISNNDHAGDAGLLLIFDRLERRCSAWVMPVGVTPRRHCLTLFQATHGLLRCLRGAFSGSLP